MVNWKEILVYKGLWPESFCYCGGGKNHQEYKAAGAWRRICAGPRAGFQGSTQHSLAREEPHQPPGAEVGPKTGWGRTHPTQPHSLHLVGGAAGG